MRVTARQTLTLAALLAAALAGTAACGGDSKSKSTPEDAGNDASAGGSGGSGGGAGTSSGGSSTGGTSTGGVAGGDAAADAPEDAPAEAQGCTDAGTTFACSELLTGAQVSYDTTTSEIVLQLPSSFPKMKHISAHSDISYGTANTTCDSFEYDITPPSTTIRIPFSATKYPNIQDTWVRDLQLTDECDGVHALDPAANGGCDEPYAKIGTPPSITCAANSDANCKWECG